MERAGLETMAGRSVESTLRGRTDAGDNRNNRNNRNKGTRSVTKTHSGTMPHRCQPVNLAAPNFV